MEPEEQEASNQPSTSNSTDVDEQGKPIGARQYNVQGDLVIKQYRGPPPVDVNPLAEELKQKLSVRANEVVGETVLPIHLDRAIERVQLQISTVIQRSDADWNESHDWQNHMERKSLDTIYQSNASRISIDQIFTKAKETAQMEAEKQCKSDAAKKLYIKQHGNTIIILGLPGIGKSTLSKMVTKSILDKKISPDTEYLFYISMKNVNFKKKVTTLQFLIDNGMIMFPTDSNKENKALIDMLHNNPNVVIVMDGLDEAATKFSKKTHRCTINGKEKPEDIIKNLFNGTLLPNAIKLVTSRPGQFYQIHPDCRPTFVLEVLGLDQDAIDDLGSQICGERYPEIKKYLKERPNLSALCYVPVNCILIMACLLICLSTGKEINSMTQVLIYALTHYMTSEHLKSDMAEDQISLELVKLSQLAFKGFKKQKLVFNIKDFKKVKIKEAMANNFMHTYVDKASGMRMKILEGHKRSYFSHLMWQEFLTAVYMMLFMPYQQFQSHDFIFEEFQWEVVARFMFGICNKTSKMDLELIFPSSEIKDFKEKIKMIRSIISGQKIDLNKDNFNTLLGKVSGWMHELDDKKIIKQIEQYLPTDITMKVPPNPAQARDLAFAFKSCSALHNLTVKANDHATPETTAFLRGLQGSTKTRIKKLVLDRTKLGNVAEYLVPHIQHIDELRLENCKQLNDCMRDLYPAINDRPNKIVLDIQSEFDDNAASCLADCLHKVSRLRIDERRISLQSRIILCETVQQLPSLVVDGELATSWEVGPGDHPECVKRILQLQPGKIKKLVLNETELGNVAEYLVPHIQHIDELRLVECKQLNDCMQDLCTAINDRPNKIVLDIQSEFDESAASCLADCLHNVSRLQIDEKKISVQSRIILHEAVQQLPSELVVVDKWGSKHDGAKWATLWKVGHRYPFEDMKRILRMQPGKIKKLELDGTELGNVAEYLVPHIQHIDELRLENCKQLNVCMRDLCTAINDRPNKIKLTVRSVRVLYDHTAQCLAGCVGKISELDLEWSKLSPEGQLMLQEAIQQLIFPQIKLTVRSYVRLDDHAAQCLAGCVGKISELDLNWDRLSPEGQRMLQEAIQQLPSPQIKLTVNSYERLDDHAAQCLAGSVGKISELDLNWNELSPEGQLMLQKAIQKLPSPQIKLTVGSNRRLDDHAAQCLAGCVGKISELDLDWNKLSPEGQVMLQEAIQRLPSPQIKLILRSYGRLDNWRLDDWRLDDWRLDDVRLDDHTAQCLAGCVGKISELDLDWNILSPEGQRMLQEAIQQLTPPKNFILKGHKINDLKKWFKEYKSAMTEPKQLGY